MPRATPGHDEGWDEQAEQGWAESVHADFFEQQSAEDPAARDGRIPCGDQHGLCDIGGVASRFGKRGPQQRGGSAEGKARDTDRRVDRGGDLAPDAQRHRRKAETSRC
jgi:hypothetical protein